MLGSSPSSVASIVAIAHYIGADPLQQEAMAPPVPAVYSWIFDFTLLLGRPEDEVDEGLRRFGALQGRSISPRGDPFLSATWKAVRPPLHPERQALAVDHISKSTKLGQQLAAMGNQLQRPSYCGISANFHQRLTQHLDRRSSHLLDDLFPVLDMDCSVLWVPVDTSELVLQDADDDENDDFRLRVFESFIIRTAAPLFNETMDS